MTDKNAHPHPGRAAPREGALAGYLVFDKDGRYLDFQTGFDIADGDRKAGLTSKPVYFAAHPHPARPGAEDALAYATRLAQHMADNHYPEVPQWKPLPDLYGVLTQIDNMLTGLTRKAGEDAEPVAPESGARSIEFAGKTLPRLGGCGTASPRHRGVFVEVFGLDGYNHVLVLRVGRQKMIVAGAEIGDLIKHMGLFGRDRLDGERSVIAKQAAEMARAHPAPSAAGGDRVRVLKVAVADAFIDRQNCKLHGPEWLKADMRLYEAMTALAAAGSRDGGER